VLNDSWRATGDLARIDRDGNSWRSGWGRDLIVLASGLNVLPQDIGDVLSCWLASAMCHDDAAWPPLTMLVLPEKTGVFAGLKAAAESVAIPLS
jgi:long-subunit acyl-CoA synthetase (AMP-forming)